MTPRTTPDAEPVFELVEQDEIGGLSFERRHCCVAIADDLNVMT